MSEFLTVAQAAELFRCSPSTIRRLSKAELPHVKKRFGLRFLKADLERWMEKDKRNPASFFVLPEYPLSWPEMRLLSGGQKSELSKLSKSKTHHNFGYGSIYQRKTMDGDIRWYVDYRDRGGKRHQQVVPYALSADEAKLALEKEIRKAFDQECGIIREHSKTRFEDFATVYLDNYAKVMKRSWKRSDWSHIRAHLNPAFGKTILSEITKFSIERYIAKRQGDQVERRPGDKVKKSTINR